MSEIDRWNLLETEEQPFVADRSLSILNKYFYVQEPMDKLIMDLETSKEFFPTREAWMNFHSEYQHLYWDLTRTQRLLRQVLLDFNKQRQYSKTIYVRRRLKPIVKLLTRVGNV